MADSWYYTTLGDLIEAQCRKQRTSLSGRHVLDLGCGSGRGLEEIGKRFGLNTWGFSLEPIEADIMRKFQEDVFEGIKQRDENWFSLILAVNFFEYVVYDLMIKGRNERKARLFMHYLVDVLERDGLLAVYEPKTYQREIMTLIRGCGLRIELYKDAGGSHTAFYLIARKV